VNHICYECNYVMLVYIAHIEYVSQENIQYVGLFTSPKHLIHVTGQQLRSVLGSVQVT